MANDPITFFCPACRTKLTIPATLAGVTGPCPCCSQVIQAPVPPPVQAVHPAQPMPVAMPSYPTDPPPPAASAPPPPAPAAPPAQATASSSPAVLRPEPRQLPHRTGHEPAVKPMQSSGLEQEGRRGTYSNPRSRVRSKLRRAAMPAFCICLLLAAMYGVKTILRNQGGAVKKPTPSKVEPARATKGPEQNPTLPQSPGDEASLAIPVSEPPRPDVAGADPELPNGIEPADPAAASEGVLHKFLEAKSLADRLPLIETHTAESELANTVLSKPLPETSSVACDLIDRNPIEQVMDIYYSVDFLTPENRRNPQTILVRTRGSSEPKIVADPFLDTFGGRLAAYATTPTDKGGVFEVIVSAFAACNDERVPNREKKMTLKLMAREDSKEIARAYFGRQSKICQMLEDGTYTLSYAKAKACTVLLRWNLEDRPETPYLEALDIKRLDWNP